MKKSLLILVAGFALAIVVGLVCYWIGSSPHSAMSDTPGAEIAWIKHEFHLSDAEFAHVTALHQAYQPVCRDNCRQVDELNARLKTLLASHSNVTPEIEAILTEAARLRTHCQIEMLRHFTEVSRAMPPEQGRRYLDWVQEETLMPSASGMSHGSALRMNHGH